jgi:electron-transferring-flavoprotein dehydrogenase
MGDGHIALGLVAGLDWKDPDFDCHEELQNLKKHPFVQPFIRGGEIVAYGAKTIPEGGYWSIPKVWTSGAMLIGDSAGLVDVKRLKGIPHAMKSGMLAADAAFEAIQEGDTSAAGLERYWDRLERSFVIRDLWKRRNFRRAFDAGLYSGMARMLFWDLTGGGPRQRMPEEPDYKQMGRARDFTPRKAPEGFDRKLLSDKLTNVYRSGTTHREDQPSHIRILDPTACITTCMPRHGVAPCTNFCPAQVYELVEEGEERKIQVNFSNCVHCKTCTILDPCDVDTADGIQNIEWRAPAEGGPKYRYL